MLIGGIRELAIDKYMYIQICICNTIRFIWLGCPISFIPLLDFGSANWLHCLQFVHFLKQTFSDIGKVNKDL